MDEFLSHHGILGQKWGARNGPPYPLKGGDYSPEEKRAKRRKQVSLHDVYNKRHFDKTINKDETLSTLSYDKNRTKNAEMFYAAYDKWDKHLYNGLFNDAVKQPIYDPDGNEIGSGTFLKYRIDNVAKSGIKVASEDSGAKVFKELYKNDRDFYNFVTGEDRMQSYFVKSKMGFRGYREAAQALEKLKNGKETPTEEDVWKVYRMFNYCIPYDGAGDARRAKDMAHQRAKFFKALKAAGYGAVLDTNDAIYGSFKASAPVIVFDTDAIIPKEAYRTKLTDSFFSRLITYGRKVLPI